MRKRPVEGRIYCSQKVPYENREILIFQKIGAYSGPVLKKSDQSTPLNNSHVVCKIVNVNNGIYRYTNW